MTIAQIRMMLGHLQRLSSELESATAQHIEGEVDRTMYDRLIEDIRYQQHRGALPRSSTLSLAEVIAAHDAGWPLP